MKRVISLIFGLLLLAFIGCDNPAGSTTLTDPDDDGSQEVDNDQITMPEFIGNKVYEVSFTGIEDGTVVTVSSEYDTTGITIAVSGGKISFSTKLGAVTAVDDDYQPSAYITSEQDASVLAVKNGQLITVSADGETASSVYKSEKFLLLSKTLTEESSDVVRTLTSDNMVSMTKVVDGAMEFPDDATPGSLYLADVTSQLQHGKQFKIATTNAVDLSDYSDGYQVIKFKTERTIRLGQEAGIYGMLGPNEEYDTWNNPNNLQDPFDNTATKRWLPDCLLNGVELSEPYEVTINDVDYTYNYEYEMRVPVSEYFDAVVSRTANFDMLAGDTSKLSSIKLLAGIDLYINADQTTNEALITDCYFEK